MQVPNIDDGLNTGLTTIFTNDNIAIAVLMMCLVFSGIFNIVLISSFFKLKDTLYSLATTIAILNERLGNHHEDN